MVAQQKPEKPTSATVESNSAVQGPVFDVGPGITPAKPIFTPDTYRCDQRFAPRYLI
jgi:hypothetical protein